MAHELEVWLFTDHVGTLSLVNGTLSFTYSPNWLSNPEAIVLSASLPLQSETFDDQVARPFFAGLLPEGDLRRLLAQQFQISRQNDFALLDRIGGECAGAVTLVEPGQQLHESRSDFSERNAIQWLDDRELIAMLDELPRRPMMAGNDGLRLSLAGAQDKLPVVFDGSRIGLPRNGTPSSHILKPAIQAVEESVTNEGFCMALAEAMKLKPAKSSIHHVENRSFLLVERYDRRIDDEGNRQRIHQEDFCQALGTVPEMKYQNEGGPGLSQCFELVRHITRPSAPEVLRLLDIVIFNALIGNHDAHGKNFSLLYGGRAPVLAPFYDLISTAVYPRLTPKMAMKIGSKYKFTEVHNQHWEQFVESVGFTKAQAKRRIVEIAKSLPTAARKLQADANQGFYENTVVAQIVTLIEQRCALTVQRLAESTD